MVTQGRKVMKVPLTEMTIAAITKMIDDAQADNRREPSHSDLEFAIARAGLAIADPKSQGQTVGKAKRVRAVLYWALEHDLMAGEKLFETIFTKVKVLGGFREHSPNYVGQDAIKGAIEAFKVEGLILAIDGSIQTQSLDSLHGRALTDALRIYSNRARKGAEDAALLSGTSKDLLEATAAHVLTQKYGSYPQQSNFQALMGQAFIALGLATPEEEYKSSEAPQRSMERGLYHSAIGINRLRNKQGTGHGRPWIPSITETEAKAAIEMAGIIAGYMLDKLENK
ncbi:abortive infection family protein [Serratia marcescens]|nr:abortive infection family protein [Serratia marcescens]MBH2816349.1 abortive infection family protein [Serratia marcescens]MBH3233200.1 abortive infection family protein [Serratia marcescens]HEI9783064.1 abortive infection family protein [Serratia marcescens]